MGNFLINLKLRKLVFIRIEITSKVRFNEPIHVNAKATDERKKNIEKTHMKVVIRLITVFYTQIGSIIPITNLSIFIKFRVSSPSIFATTFIIQEILVYQQ